MKTKKFKEFINIEVGINIVNDKVEIKNNYKDISESKSSEELKKAAEIIGLDLTKNLSKRIDLI